MFFAVLLPEGAVVEPRVAEHLKDTVSVENVQKKLFTIQQVAFQFR